MIPFLFIPDQNFSVINRGKRYLCLICWDRNLEIVLILTEHVIQQESSSEDNRLWTKPEYEIIYMLTRVLWSRLFPVTWNYNVLVSSQFATDAPGRIVLRCHRFRYVGCCVKLVVQFSFCKAKRTSRKCQQEKFILVLHDLLLSYSISHVILRVPL